MSKDIKDFTDAYDGYSRNKSQRSKRKGFLKLLSILDRIQSEISIDFITDLLKSEECRNMIVITNRLSKEVVVNRLDDLKAETVVKQFIRRYYLYHFLFFTIVSDRGAQFISTLQTRICRILRIKKRLLTAFSLETDRSTERMNQIIEAFLREFMNHA